MSPGGPGQLGWQRKFGASRGAFLSLGGVRCEPSRAWLLLGPAGVPKTISRQTKCSGGPGSPPWKAAARFVWNLMKGPKPSISLNAAYSSYSTPAAPTRPSDYLTPARGNTSPGKERACLPSSHKLWFAFPAPALWSQRCMCVRTARISDGPLQPHTKSGHSLSNLTNLVHAW